MILLAQAQTFPQKSYLDDVISRPTVDVVVGFQSQWKTAYVARLYEHLAVSNSIPRIAVTPHELEMQVKQATRGDVLLFDNEFVDTMNKFYFASALKLAKLKGLSVVVSLTDFKHVGDNISGTADYILRFLAPKRGKIFRLQNNFMGKRRFQFVGNLAVGMPNEEFFRELQQKQLESHIYSNPRGADSYDHLVYQVMNVPIRRAFKLILEERFTNVGLITGRTGGGKSSLCLSIANENDPDFDPSTHVLFRPEELLRIPKTFDEGSWVVWDEAELAADSRRFMTHNSVKITQMFETFRDRHISVLINCPEEGLIDSRLRGQNITNWHIIPFWNRIKEAEIVCWPQFYIVGKRKLQSATKVMYGFEEHWKEPEVTFPYISSTMWEEYKEHKEEALYGQEPEQTEEELTEELLREIAKLNRGSKRFEEMLPDS